MCIIGLMAEHKIFSMSVADVYPHYVTKAERKQRTEKEVKQVIEWLTGYDSTGLAHALDKRVSFRDFFADAPDLNENRRLITGSVCGVKVQEIEEPLMQEIHYLDKLIDELAKGRPMEKILRS